MSTHNLCFEQKYEKYQYFLFENFHFLVVKFSIHLNRNVFVMGNGYTFRGGNCQNCFASLLKRGLLGANSFLLE